MRCKFRRSKASKISIQREQRLRVNIFNGDIPTNSSVPTVLFSSCGDLFRRATSGFTDELQEKVFFETEAQKWSVKVVRKAGYNEKKRGFKMHSLIILLSLDANLPLVGWRKKKRKLKRSRRCHNPTSQI